MEFNLAEALVQGGPLAILAGIIFFMYVKEKRADAIERRDDRIFMEDRLTKIVEADLKAREQSADAMTKNAEALKELTVYLKLRNGDRK